MTAAPLLLTPATARDLDDLLAAEMSPAGLGAYTRLLRQIEIGPAWTVRTADRAPVAIGGVLSAEGWPDEAWFLAGPAAGSRLVPLVGIMRRQLRQCAPASRTGIVARVRTGNDAGERLARALGFTATGLAQAILPAAQIWVLGVPAACSSISTPPISASSAGPSMSP